MTANGSIVPALHEIQERCGYLPREELEALAARGGDRYPLHRLHEVASFFPHFRLSPPPDVEVQVCRDMACHLAGAPALLKDLQNVAADRGGGADRVAVTGVSCLGRCDAAPAVVIGPHVYRGLAPAAYLRLLETALTDPAALPSPAADRSPAGWNIDPYDGREDYAAVRTFVAQLDSDGLIAQFKVADLRGMGGAGVWAHQKWKDVRDARGDPKYVICNADESEPSTFKDRELLLRAPHLVIEAVILGGLVVGAERGFIYIRHEYPEQIAAVREAIERATKLGVCGANVLGTGRSFSVEVFVSPGGYICGEQSALVEAMEGRRAEPRNKPPLLETNGLFDKPTLLSNVETFAWVPAIALRGGAWYRDLGVNGAKGMRFFSISGDVNRPGVYEVPVGITLGTLIDQHAGGMRGGRALKAFAPSGPSGGFLPALLPRASLSKGFEQRVPERFLKGALPDGATHLDIMDLELDLQLFRDLGLMLGAGMVVYGERTDMVDQALNASQFFRNESCGKCVPCRIGSRKLVDLGTRLRDREFDGASLPAAEGLVADLRQTLELTSICGLGMVAAAPFTSIFQHFRGDLVRYVSHLEAADATRPENTP